MAVSNIPSKNYSRWNLLEENIISCNIILNSLLDEFSLINHESSINEMSLSQPDVFISLVIKTFARMTKLNGRN